LFRYLVYLATVVSLRAISIASAVPAVAVAPVPLAVIMAITGWLTGWLPFTVTRTARLATAADLTVPATVATKGFTAVVSAIIPLRL
jgi:ABC-type multidrug transport system permease subunit